MDDRLVLLERETGLHVGWYLWLRLLDEVNRAARYGGPFAVVMLELSAPTPRDATAAAALVTGTIRGTDLAGRTGAAQVAILLVQPDEDAASKATERILAQLATGSPEGVTWHPTLYCYPRDAADVSHLLTAPHAGADRRVV